jgi:hypothetical protein
MNRDRKGAAGSKIDAQPGRSLAVAVHVALHFTVTTEFTPP